MAESNVTQVILTDDGIKIIKAQSTADNATSGVTNLNDPNLMSVIEKQNNIGQFAGLTSQYNVILQNARDDGIDTTALTMAYNNLNTFMADILADPNHASDIDRARYKKYQDAYNEELAKLQNALQNNTNDKFTSAASALSQAASTANVAKSAADSTYAYANSEIAVQSTATAKAQSAADNAFNKAQEVGNQASSEIAVQSEATAKAQNTADNAFNEAQSIGSQTNSAIAVQSNATAKAQSTADSAFSQAITAIDTGKATSQAVTALKDGSTLTIAQLGNGLASKVSNSEYASYKEQTASQIGQMVTNGAFSAYQQTTADLISSKVATKDFSAYQATTAKAIESKVESKDFNTYKTQTADLIDDKVSSSQYSSDKTQTASEIADRVSNSAFSTYQTQTASQIASKVDNGDFSTYKTQTANLIAQKVATKDFSAYQATTAKAISSKVESKDFNTYKTQTADKISSKVESSDFQTLQTQVDNSVVGTNLFLQSTATAGYIDRVTGNVDPASSFQNEIASDYIPVSASSAYTFQMWGTTPSGNYYWYGIGLYDSDKKFISRPSVVGATQSADTTEHVSKAITTTSTTAYVRVSFRKYNDFKAKFEKGGVATDFSLNPADTATQSQITQLSGEIEQKVNSGDFNTYKTQTAGLIAERVANSDFSTYKTQTADLIASKVANKDFSTYKTQTADLIASKVESKDFNTYKTQTADVIASKVESKDFQALQTQVDNSAVGTNLLLNTSDYSTNWTWNVTPSIDTTQKPAILHYPRTTISSGTSTIAKQTIGSILRPSTTYTASFYAKGSGNFIFYCYPGVASTTISVNGIVVSSTSSDCRTIIPLTPSYVRYTITFTTLSSISDSKNFLLRQDHNYSDTSYNTVEAYVYGMKLEKGAVATDWSINLEEQATQSQITQLSGEIDLRVTKGDLVDQINVQAGKTLISSSGQLILSGKSVFLDSANPVIMKSANIDKLLVGKKLTAADISANTFTTNNGTFTVNQNGAITAKDMTLSGGKLTSPTINASTINGSTINGTTFNAGDIINNPNNTAKYYPMTITPDGTYKSTYFDSAVGLQSSVESGAISYKYRSMIGNGQYLAYDSVINGQGFESHSGYTSVKDTTFSNTETITGYVNVTPSSGIYLYGPTQKINFAGNSGDMGTNGITMDAYGNVYAQNNSAYWRIRDVNSNDIVNFGIDSANKRNISLYRDTQVGNLFLGVGHTIGMLDSSPLYFKKGDSRGRMLGLYAGAIHYENLIKSSLLSVKRDVKKVDTAYWAQLVNSIDLATYQYKTDDNTSHIRLSSIVDDVNDTKQWQLPDVFVSRDEDGKLCGVDDSVLLNATLATVQEQQKEIDQLNGHNMELEARLNKLEAKLNG